MKSPALDSSFEVAYWFVDTALNDNEYLQPQKMQRLMFLAQAYYAVANHGQMLMPSIFLADEMGPIEPQVYRLFENERPFLELKPIPNKIKSFLDSIWRRFGSHSSDYLTKTICNHPPFFEALKEGNRTPITIEAMVDYYGKPSILTKDKMENSYSAPTLENVLRPRVMLSQDGKPVSVKAWVPKKKAEKK